MRVSIIGPAHPYKGGAAQHTTTLAHRLAGDGHDVTLESWYKQYPAVLYPGQLTVSEPEVPLFHPTRRRLSWRRPDGWIRQGRRIGRSSDLVVLMYHSAVQITPYLAILRALRGTGARTVVIANNVASHESGTADRLLVPALLRRVDKILVHHDDQAIQARAITSKPIVVAPLPPHPPGPAPITESPNRDVELPRNRLLFFGLVRPYKGLDVLLRALAQATALPELLVAGEFWQNEKELRELTDNLGLAGRVTFRPHYVEASDIPGLFADADALVLPYRTATGSQNASLAFHHGIPVIVTKTGSLADPVTDNVDGIICTPDDVDDLTRAIDRFYEPGVPARLRAAVTFDDGTERWNTYMRALTNGVT